MLLFSRKPFFEMDSGSAGPVDLGTPPLDLSNGPAPGNEEQPTETGKSEFAQYMGKDLSSYPEEMRPIIIERLKEMDSAFTPAMQKFKPWSTLAEEGITPEQVRQAMAVQRLITEDPKAAMRLLQSLVPQEESQASTSTTPAPEPDPLASLSAYDDDVAVPIRTAYEIARRAEQTAAQLQAQLAKERADREKEALVKAIERAETGMTGWLGKNAYLGVTPEQLRAELKKAGQAGIMAGFTDADYEAAALKVLGPEKYRAAVYAEQLKAARAKVGQTQPGPVVDPGVATGSAPANGPGFENPKAMLDGAIEFINNLRRQSGA